jgi:hypothetical protein
VRAAASRSAGEKLREKQARALLAGCHADLWCCRPTFRTSGRPPDIDPRRLRRAREPLTIDRRTEQSALAPPAALLERGHEIERIRDMLGAVGRRDAGVVVIEGAAGMGKSRLLEEACDVASALGVRVIGSRATELERGFPFGVMRQLFERPLLEAESAERERWLAGAAALAVEILTGAPTTADTAAAVRSTADPGYAWLHGLYWLASNLSTESPLVLMVDDLQWCDAPSARALAFIGRRLTRQPLGLILSSRPLDPGLTPRQRRSWQTVPWS